MHKTIRLFIASILISAGFSTAASALELPDFTDLINATSPAAVKINVRSTSRQSSSAREVPEAYRDFFDFDEEQSEQTSVGSGFIIAEDGYVLTNFHVIEGADEILVRLNNRQEYFAEVLGTDEQSDLALLKIEGSDLPTVKFAQPESLEVGDWVLAIGSPFDLDYSASVGIVSAIGRSLPNSSGQNNYVPFIQTDVAINPGNSGGPLFNLDGEVVGVNSQIYTRSGGFMGLSFAIPSAVAQDVVEQLLDGGEVLRGWLGVVIQDINQDLATSFGLDRPHGALINQVMDESPAQRSGLLAGDIVVEFDAHQIEYSHDLPHVVGLIEPGSRVQAVIYREGARENIEVELGTLPNQVNARSSSRDSGKSPRNSSNAIFGMELSNIDEATSRELGISGGVLIESIQPGSPAVDAGLQAGDIVVQLGFSEVTNREEISEVAENLQTGKMQLIRFYRDGNPIFRTIDIN
jgi:serine protease Do